VRAMVRRQEAAARLEQLGAQSVVADLNYDVAYALRGCEALVFAAGAPLHGDSDGVDYRGTVRLIEAAEVQGVRRFVLISSLGTSYPERLPLALRLHLEAKRRAEVALEASGLDYTVVKPGALTDAPGCGRLELAPLLGHGGSVPRDDVAELVSAGPRPPAQLRGRKRHGGDACGARAAARPLTCRSPQGATKGNSACASARL
jgi:uncharacterized protein YbjT (DUF2867 family)